jgi:hypothetical protein
MNSPLRTSAHQWDGRTGQRSAPARTIVLHLRGHDVGSLINAGETKMSGAHTSNAARMIVNAGAVIRSIMGNEAAWLVGHQGRRTRVVVRV